MDLIQCSEQSVHMQGITANMLQHSKRRFIVLECVTLLDCMLLIYIQ